MKKREPLGGYPPDRFEHISFRRPVSLTHSNGTWKDMKGHESKMKEMNAKWKEMNATWKEHERKWMHNERRWKDLKVGKLDFNYVGEDPSYHGDNVVYICRSLRLTPFSLQHNRRAADPGLRCVYLRNYRTTFAPEEPRRSQVQNPVFSSRSSDI